MSDDIVKLYKSITKQSQNTTDNARENSSEPKTRSQINFLNINLNEYLSINNKTSQTTAGSNQPKIIDNDHFGQDSLKRKREKCSKGLRHFSMKVCEKVKQKNITTYNQVAEELVSEYCQNQSSNGQSSSIQNDFLSYDQKNVRRRVYDALNVLMAMNIISKEKKEIRWIGLPCNTKQECNDLEIDRSKRLDRIEQKSQTLKNLILEHIAIKSLIERNKMQSENKSKIELPFVALCTDNKTAIDLNITNDRKEYSIQLDNTFEISSDIDILKRLGLTCDLGETKTDKILDSNETEKIVCMVPQVFQCYVEQLTKKEKFQAILLDESEFPNFGKICQESMFEVTKNVRAYRKNLKNSNSIATDKIEDDTFEGGETDDENSFENYDDEEDIDEDEEDDLAEEDNEDEASVDQI
ncbi:transcription factor Dp-1 isoform X1 [Brachionus plicatilis]|uniref:Transcription factor Dp-1 isoform X1 n=1 Tax=Brachionus plicatilis TaxID=10195 RepID=A0A3M7R4Z4_BRAPC|nr:transcription factor Dp-1 isoform X1 [Brachionus plicatilis]